MVKLSDIIEHFDDLIIAVHGDVDGIEIDGIAAQGNSAINTLDWINRSKTSKQDIAHSSASRAILADPEVIFTKELKDGHKVLITVNDPRTAIGLIGNTFFIKPPVTGINPSAKVSRQAKLGLGVGIGANVVIGVCEIGDNAVIMHNAVVHDGVKIGSNVLIQSGAVLGTDGLGCTREVDGALTKFPHLGGLIIHDNVEVGANSSIAKGALGDTVVGKGTKINALCYIGHNCHIGANVLIAGGSNLNGSVTIGKDSAIFSNCVIRDQVEIGERVIVGMGSVVTKNIPDDEIWAGNPAKKLCKD